MIETVVEAVCCPIELWHVRTYVLCAVSAPVEREPESPVAATPGPAIAQLVTSLALQVTVADEPDLTRVGEALILSTGLTTLTVADVYLFEGKH